MNVENNTTAKQNLWLDMLELMTDENYMFTSKKKAIELLQTYKNELKERVAFKYFLDEYEEKILLIEVYFDSCYVYTFECKCDREVTKNDTLDTVNVVSYSKWA